MPSTLLTVIAWSYGLAGAVYLAFAVRLALAPERSLRGWMLLWATGWSAVWGLSTMAFSFTQAAPLLAVEAVADALAYGGWYAFLLSLLARPRERGASEMPEFGWLFAICVAVVAWALAVQVFAALGVAILGATARVGVLNALAAAVLGLVVLEQVFRNATEESRWAITPLCVGLAVAFGYDVYTFADGLLFGRLDADAWSVRGFVHALVVPLLMLTRVRNQGAEYRIVLSRQVMFRSTALALSGLYLMFVAAAGYYVRYFGGEWGHALQLALLVAGVAMLGVLLFSGSMRARFRVLVSKHFFSYRYDYREEWLRFTQALSGQGANAAVGQQVIKGLADMVESPGGGLWLRQPTRDRFVLGARWNVPGSDGIEDTSGEFIQFLSRTGWVINLEEFRSSPDRYGTLRLPTWLSEISSAWLVIPLSIGTELIGFAVLATPRTRIEVNWEVNDLLKTAGRQAASFLGQVQATEALLEARKFDAFNRMSAFVVHDLKNIIAQLSLMVRNAERHRDNPEFQQDMLMTVEHSVERMKQLMLQLRDGTTPLDVTHKVDLAEVAARIQRAKAAQKPAVELEVQEPAAVRAHEDRLERVMGHLVQNALDATEANGRVWIKIGRSAGSAMVEIGDTGHGMTAEFVRERLFKPFHTTKQTGMGIGAYESHQYVTELGGELHVDTAPGSGTRVTLQLPLFDPAAAVTKEHSVA